MRGLVSLCFVLLTAITRCIAETPPDSVCGLTFSEKVYPEIPDVPEENIHFTNEDLSSDFRFVIVTNRGLENDKSGKLRFSNKRGDKLHYLIISRSGNEWMVRVRQEFAQTFNSIDTYKPFLFYVHGYGKTFPGVIRDGAAFLNYYNVNLVIFDWPTHYPSPLKIDTYRFSKINALNSAKDFVTVLNNFQEYKKQYWRDNNTHTTLLIHSLGNSIIEKSVKDSLLSGIEKNLFTNIILNAPAVEYKNHDRWVESLKLQENLYVTTNNKDLSFFGLWWLTMKTHLGGRKMPALADNATYINFSVAGRSHNYFLNPQKLTNNSNVKKFYESIFYGNEIHTDNTCMFSHKKDNYYIK
jgi:hypothetical protein